MKDIGILLMSLVIAFAEADFLLQRDITTGLWLLALSAAFGIAAAVKFELAARRGVAQAAPEYIAPLPAAFSRRRRRG